MDELIATTLRNLLSHPYDVSLALRYYHLIMRAGGAYPLELTYLTTAINNIPTIQDDIENGLEEGWVTYDGRTIQDIQFEMQSDDLNYLESCFGVDTATPPPDFGPMVWYLGWFVEGLTNVLVVIFSTRREQAYEVDTPHFWYMELRGENCTPRKSDPGEYPALLATVEANHPGIIHLYNELEEAHNLASELWDVYTDHELAAQEAVCVECGDAAPYNPDGDQYCGGEQCRHILREEIRDEAATHVNNYSYDELDGMPTLGVGQTSNRKIDTGHIRIWLSRCGIADGCALNNAVEIEVYNPVDGYWENFADFPSDPDEQHPSNVIWY